MPPLNITAADVLGSASPTGIVTISGSTTKIKAGHPIKLRFTFDRTLATDETATIRCHLYEPIFEINSYLKDIVSVPTPTAIVNEMNKLPGLASVAANSATVAATSATAAATAARTAATKATTAATTSGVVADNTTATTATTNAQEAATIAQEATTKATEATADVTKVSDATQTNMPVSAEELADKVDQAASKAEEAATKAEEVANALTTLSPTESAATTAAVATARTAATNARTSAGAIRTTVAAARNAITAAPNTHTATIESPEELAGANIRMTFYLKQDPDDLVKRNTYGTATPPVAGATPDPIGKTIEILSKGAPPKRIHKIYFGKSDRIEFGVDDALEVFTGVHHKNHKVYMHIHTRGLYGQKVHVARQFKPLSGTEPTHEFTTSQVQIKNNTAVEIFTVSGIAAQVATWGTGANAIKKIRIKASVNAAGSGLKYSAPYADLDITNDGPIILTAKPQVAQSGRDISTVPGSDAQCRLEFRPDPNYDGSFGFSWFRKGDTYPAAQIVGSVTNTVSGFSGSINQNSNDQNFEITMGRHYDCAATAAPRTNGIIIQDGNKGSADFDPDPQMVTNHKYDYRKLLLNNMPLVEYLVPVMTIRPLPPTAAGGNPIPVTASLQIFIEAHKNLDKIEFEFDNPRAISDGYFTVTNQIPGMSANNSFQHIPEIVNITCHKEFSKELMLWAKAYPVPVAGETITPDVCGAIRILPNDVSHQRNVNVVFLNMLTNLNSLPPPAATTSGLASGHTKVEEIKKYLGQAYINPIVLEEDFLFALPAPAAITAALSSATTAASNAANAAVTAATDATTAAVGAGAPHTATASIPANEATTYANQAVALVAKIATATPGSIPALIDDIATKVDQAATKATEAATIAANGPATIQAAVATAHASAIVANTEATTAHTEATNVRNAITAAGATIKGTVVDEDYTNAIHNPDYLLPVPPGSPAGTAPSLNLGYTLNSSDDATTSLFKFVVTRLGQVTTGVGSATMADHYKDYFKIFFFGDICIRPVLNALGTHGTSQLGGFVNTSERKLVFLFSGMGDDSTPAHELLHGLGLAHTFDGTNARAKYVYQHSSTDNIMDYSHYMKVGGTAVGKTQSLFHWQMQAINNNL